MRLTSEIRKSERGRHRWFFVDEFEKVHGMSPSALSDRNATVRNLQAFERAIVRRHAWKTRILWMLFGAALMGAVLLISGFSL